MGAEPVILFPGTITVDEFDEMDLPDSCEWELIDGTVVSVTFPDLDHIDLQDHITGLLKAQLPFAVVRTEYPYTLGIDSRFRADVGVTSSQRHRENRKRLAGAPELIVEVMSRSNTDKKIRNLQDRCFAQGCQIFWRVYPRRRVLTHVVTGPVISETESRIGDTLEFSLFDAAVRISVGDIFSFMD